MCIIGFLADLIIIMIKIVPEDDLNESLNHAKIKDNDYLPVDEHVEQVSENGKSVTYRGIFLLPNLLTTAALFCGFFSVLSSIQGDTIAAIYGIILAGFFDMLDGRVARLLNVQSQFGAEYDSLSDLISFGVAPSLLVFVWNLSSIGKLGWVLSFIYLCCAALRVARFNTQIDGETKSYFSGLSSPAAAGMLTSTVWLLTHLGVESSSFSPVVQGVFLLTVLLISLLMISNIPYYSFKTVKVKRRVPFAVFLAIIFIMMCVVSVPPLFFFLFGVVYCFSGLFTFIYTQLKTRST